MRAWHAAGLLDQGLRVRLGFEGPFTPLREMGPAPFGGDALAPAPDATRNADKVEIDEEMDDLAWLAGGGGDGYTVKKANKLLHNSKPRLTAQRSLRLI